MKNALFLLALLLGLVACTSAMATPTPTVIRLPTATETPVPSPTDTLQPTDTMPPTSTVTHEPTATPDVAARAAVTTESFRNFNNDTGFISVTHEEALQLNNDIISGEALQLANIDSIDPVILYDADGIQVWISATIGSNLFPLFVIAEPGEHGIEHNVLWAIVGKDTVSGKNVLNGLKMSFDPQYLNDDGTETRVTINNLTAIANLTRVEIHLVTQRMGVMPPQINPVIKDVTGGTNPVRLRLQQLIVDDKTGTVSVWVRDIMSP